MFGVVGMRGNYDSVLPKLHYSSLCETILNCGCMSLGWILLMSAISYGYLRSRNCNLPTAVTLQPNAEQEPSHCEELETHAFYVELICVAVIWSSVGE